MTRRNPYGDSDQSGANIDMAPMIDCVFLLLIFFIVTSVFVSDPGIEVQKPDVTGTETTDRNALLVALAPNGGIHFDGQEIRLDQLANALRQVAFGKEPTVIIRADQAASHGAFSQVYEEVRRAGVKHIRFATARGDNP